MNSYAKFLLLNILIFDINILMTYSALKYFQNDTWIQNIGSPYEKFASVKMMLCVASKVFFFFIDKIKKGKKKLCLCKVT